MLPQDRVSTMYAVSEHDMPDDYWLGSLRHFISSPEDFFSLELAADKALKYSNCGGISMLMIWVIT